MSAVAEAVTRIRAQSPLVPRVAVVLGSGLGGFARSLTAFAGAGAAPNSLAGGGAPFRISRTSRAGFAAGKAARHPRAVSIPYAELPGFPQTQVAGHAGELVLGHLADVPVAVMSGRFHYYQCGDAAAAAFPIRVLAALGANTLIVTNAAGGIRPDLTPGTLAVITDHINFIPNPLRGAEFVEMTHAYSPRLRGIAMAAASQCGVALEQGIYVAVTGPSYETPAEIRAFATLGADMVGMSTAPEVIVARHCGLEVLGISVITNPAAGVSSEPIHHQEVLDTGAAVKDKLSALLREIIHGL